MAVALPATWMRTAPVPLFTAMIAGPRQPCTSAAVMVMSPVCVPVFVAAIAAALSSWSLPPAAVTFPRVRIAIEPDCAFCAMMPPSRALIVPGPDCSKLIPALPDRSKAFPVVAATPAFWASETDRDVFPEALSVCVAVIAPLHSNTPLPDDVSSQPILVMA